MARLLVSTRCIEGQKEDISRPEPAEGLVLEDSHTHCNMKAAFCVLLLAVGAFSAEEKKNEKRGVLGLGYGLGAPAPLYGHGLGLYGAGIGGLGWGGHGLAAAPVLGHGYSAPLLGHGLYGHGYSAPLLGHGAYSAPLLGHGAYSAPLLSHAPLLGLGHGIGYGGWH